MFFAFVVACALVSGDDFGERMDVDGDGLARPEDCDDADPAVGEARDWYADADGDGYGAGEGTPSCDPISGASETTGDCDDLVAAAHPSGLEVCDGADNDCNGAVDGADAIGGATWYRDNDGDGFGESAEVLVACGNPSGYAATGGDCDDDDALIGPGVEDAPDDGVDANCDGRDARGWVTTFGNEMLAIPAGSFVMGAGVSDPFEDFIDHAVTLTRGFWIGKREVTQREWSAWPAAPVGAFDHAGCDECPAETMVSWYAAALYANALSTEEGLAPCFLDDGTDLAPEWLDDPAACPGYRLPTEAEWEYAARAGADTTYAGSNAVGDVAWVLDNSGGASHEGCTLAVNGWGLCDMSGNVFEWASDWYSNGYGGYGSGDAQVDPAGPSGGEYRVSRGGYFGGGSPFAWVSERYLDSASLGWGGLGFRLVRTEFDE